MPRLRRRPDIWLVVVAVTVLVAAGGVVALGVTTDGGATTTDSGVAAHVHSPDDRPDPALVRLGPQGAHPQFVVECGWSHSATDDPIVMPNSPGKSHLHEFFGAADADAFSTGPSLLTSDTSCENQADTASYWVAAIYDGDTRIQPEELVAYYRTGNGVDPAAVQPWPLGLKILAGDPGADTPQSTGVVGWTCGASDKLTVLPRQCSSRAPMVLRLTFPDCWDGINLDSPNHRDHTAYSTDGTCPQAQPVPVVQLILAVRYPFDEDPSGLRLASGPMITGHGDVLNGWRRDELDKLTRLCLNRGQICGVSSRRTDL
jgi:hypothetical protein